MGQKSSIEWTDATWNPVTGCRKVSQGCKFCYAERVFPRPYPGRAFTEVRRHPERLEQPLHWKRPRKIFVNSMSDLFHEDIPEEFILAVFSVMSHCPQHTFQVLTKRPERMDKIFSLWQRDGLTLRSGYGVCLPNVWLGVSVEDQETADERIPLLLQTPAAVRFVSYEPALGPVDFTSLELPSEYALSRTVRARTNCLMSMDEEHFYNRHPKVDWIIAGGESGPHARPAHPDWFRSARDQCQAAGVAYFFKQWGEWLPCDQETACSTPGPGYGKPEKMEWLRYGKKSSGRLLDGREWNEFPREA